MTPTENVIVFNLGDVRMFRLQCKKCGAVRSYLPTRWERIPATCGNCDETWNMGLGEQTLKNFSDAVEALLNASDRLKFKFQMELPKP